MACLFSTILLLIYQVMSEMPDIIISDTSCLIILSNIGELDLLRQLYSSITTTFVIADEFGQQLPDWIIIKSAANETYQQILELQVDRGEASAIALAIENSPCTLIVDDYKARKVAIGMGIAITGTLGIIIRAKINGIIPSIKPYLDKIKQTDFRLSDELIKLAYKEAGELVK